MRDPAFYRHLHFKSNQENEPDWNPTPDVRKIQACVFLLNILYTKRCVTLADSVAVFPT